MNFEVKSWNTCFCRNYSMCVGPRIYSEHKCRRDLQGGKEKLDILPNQKWVFPRRLENWLVYHFVCWEMRMLTAFCSIRLVIDYSSNMPIQLTASTGQKNMTFFSSVCAKKLWRFIVHFKRVFYYSLYVQGGEEAFHSPEACTPCRWPNDSFLPSAHQRRLRHRKVDRRVDTK